MKKNEILGVKIDNLDKDEVLEAVQRFLPDEEKHQIVTVNPEFIVEAQKDYEFKEILNRASLALADGIGLLFAAYFLFGLRLKRLTGMELLLLLINLAAKKNLRVFLLGGRPPQVVEEVIKNLKKNFPSLKVQGSAGAANIESEMEGERRAVFKEINDFKPHFLFVAYGAPWQEKWLARNLKFLDIKVAMGVGGTFDYLSGRKKRAPRLLRILGLEWSWRLGREPRYRWRRVVTATVVFPWLVLRKKVFNNPKLAK